MVICVMKGVNRFDSQSCFTAKKYTRIIELLSKKESISLDDALSFFYHSRTYPGIYPRKSRFYLGKKLREILYTEKREIDQNRFDDGRFRYCRFLFRRQIRTGTYQRSTNLSLLRYPGRSAFRYRIRSRWHHARKRNRIFRLRKTVSDMDFDWHVPGCAYHEHHPDCLCYCAFS